MSESEFTPNADQQKVIDWLKQQRAANVTASPERLAQFKAEFLQQLDGLKLTVPNQAPHATTLFYSGMVDDRQAWKVAEPLATASNGRTITIGQTELGQLANDRNIFKAALNEVIDPKKHPTQSADITTAIWDRASLRLAEAAQGAVHTITPNAIGSKVYATIELPALMDNKNVTQIDGIDRTELAALRDQLQTRGYTPERAMEVVRSRISVQSAVDLERTHGIKTVMHPELKHASEVLRSASVDMHGSAQGKALAQTAEQLDGLHLRAPSAAPAHDTAKQLPVEPVEPEKLARIRAAAKAAGLAGAAYGVYQGASETADAVDAARSNREQWVRGAEAGADVATRGTVTGIAGAGGGVLGAAGGALTSPVTGPVGPTAGAVIVGGAASVGADKLYEDSRLQELSRRLGRQVGEWGYDYVSKEGRLLREVNGLKEDLQSATDPTERARLQTRLDSASERFSTEAERNGRYFEGRANIDNTWEASHTRFPRVDKDDVEDALARHIDAGKRPDEAARAALSDAVHEKYPRALPHQPVENYRAMSLEQLAEKHRQYVGEVTQGRTQVAALAANKDSHNNVDQGWPKALAQERQAGRVQSGLDELWRDTGHLGAIREAYQARGMQPPELPPELRPATAANASAAGENRNAATSSLSPGVSPTFSPTSDRLLQDSERHVRRIAEERGLPWDKGMENTVAAVALKAREAGLSSITYLKAADGEIRFIQHDKLTNPESSISTRSAANAPAADALEKLAAVDESKRSAAGMDSAAADRQVAQGAVARGR